MRKLLLLLTLSLGLLTGFAQENEQINTLVNEGIALHDKGDYDAAIAKYDEALKIDPKHFDANYEKSLSLMYGKKFEACVQLCRFIVDTYPKHERLRQVYSNWGSALDDAGKTEEAISVYTEGINKFPAYYLLHFNRGLTYMQHDDYEKAGIDFHASLKNNALHPTSNLCLGMILQESNRIPALLSYITFIIIEPQTKRTEDAFGFVQDIMWGNIKKEGNNVTISISPEMLDPKNKKKENDFSSVEMLFSVIGAVDNSKDVDSLFKTPVGKFDFKLQMLIGSLDNNSKGAKGFYWTHFVPFFKALKEKGYSRTLSNIVYLSTDQGAKDWVSQNPDKIKEFYDWFKAYKWEE